MGAESFMEIRKGKNAQEVFDRLVEDAQWDHGHAGYTGPIAEKSEFLEFSRPKGMSRDSVIKMVDRLDSVRFLTDGQPDVEALQALYPKFDMLKVYKTYDSKWGPALCIELPNKEYLFAGWASS